MMGVRSHKARVLVVDDHPIIRQGLTLLINREPDLTVCGEAVGASSAFDAIAAHHPDILVLDISLEGPDGIDVLKSLRLRDADLPVLILSMHDEAIYAERALRAGANGYIMKQEATESVLTAIRRILGGGVYVSEHMASTMLQQFVRHPGAAGQSPLTRLSDRELEVFRLIGDGQGTRQIATRLHLSVKTVESYQAHVKDKLGLRNARELMQHAIQWSKSDTSL
jgi:DNA-binding NarL/FixJ family response regulator